MSTSELIELMNKRLVITPPQSRDYWLYTFAGQAMQGIASSAEGYISPSVIAENSVNIARALLAELEKETT